MSSEETSPAEQLHRVIQVALDSCAQKPSNYTLMAAFGLALNVDPNDTPAFWRRYSRLVGRTGALREVFRNDRLASQRALLRHLTPIERLLTGVQQMPNPAAGILGNVRQPLDGLLDAHGAILGQSLGDPILSSEERQGLLDRMEELEHELANTSDLPMGVRLFLEDCLARMGYALTLMDLGSMTDLQHEYYRIVGEIGFRPGVEVHKTQPTVHRVLTAIGYYGTLVNAALSTFRLEEDIRSLIAPVHHAIGPPTTKALPPGREG